MMKVYCIPCRIPAWPTLNSTGKILFIFKLSNVIAQMKLIYTYPLNLSL